MFSRFTTALYSAVDALAPPLPLREDFEWHWKAITKFYTGKNASNKVPIELTTIPGHLSEMLSIVEQEEKEVETGNIGPCVEYIMQHRLLDTMCVLGTSDSPPGIKRHMFKFITKMIKIVQQSLLPHVSIYEPIQKFMKLCGEVLAGPTENEEMDFLQCICEKLQENPHLINCFLNPLDANSRKYSTDMRGKPQSEVRDTDKNYVLISSLLKLYQSPDNEIALKAGECLKVCCSCSNDTAAVTITQCTDLSKFLCDLIVTLYKNIPRSLKVSDLELYNISDYSENTGKISPNMRKYLCYLQQLSFYDSLTQESHPVISDYLSSSFKSNFLDVSVHSDLVEDKSDEALLFITVLVTSSLRHISCSKLVATFGIFLLGEDEDSFSEHPYHILKGKLIKRCHNSCQSLALANLQLFEDLLHRPTQHILYTLVLKYLEGRGYYDHIAADSWLQFSDDETCSRYSDEDSSSSGSPSFINHILNSFLTLIPDEIKSCETDEESGYETYLKEAHGRFIKCLALCEDFEWPQDFPEKDYNPCTDDDSSSESQPEADSTRWIFYEGPFLSMIFDKLEEMLFQPYEINLQVTSVISQLALFAHPYLHEYLLNPLLSYTPDTRSLFLVLTKVVEDIQKEVQNISEFKTKLKLTRNALLSDGNEYATFEESNILEAIIVLEEFCKELAAIAYVKYRTNL